jgi:hypothetical protein
MAEINDNIKEIIDRNKHKSKIEQDNKNLNKIIEELKEEKRVLYVSIKNLQDMEEAHKKVNGVFQRQINELQIKIKKMEDDRLNAGRMGGHDE